MLGRECAVLYGWANCDALTHDEKRWLRRCCWSTGLSQDWAGCEIGGGSECGGGVGGGGGRGGGGKWPRNSFRRGRVGAVKHTPFGACDSDTLCAFALW